MSGVTVECVNLWFVGKKDVLSEHNKNLLVNLALKSMYLYARPKFVYKINTLRAENKDYQKK